MLRVLAQISAGALDLAVGTAAARRRARAGDALVAVSAGAAVAAAAASHGAYFPTGWGWLAIVLGWAAVLALVARRSVGTSGLELATLVALWGLTGWIALSTTWSDSVPDTVLEVERTLVYATALLAVLAAARRRGAPLLVGGVLAAIVGVCVYSLATRLFPERLGEIDDIAVNRLQQPLGYWNSLGAFAAMGLLLAVGVGARARLLPVRALAGAALPVLAATLYFTFGRGGWVALVVGALAMVAVDARRRQLATSFLALSPGAVVTVWLASRQEALTSSSPALSEASREGHRFVPVLVGLMALSAVGAAVFGLAERRLAVSARVRLVYGALLWVAAVAGVAAIMATYGSPWAIAERSYRAFVTAPAQGSTSAQRDLNRRLFTLWGNGRPEAWKVAWRVARDHPWLGAGAGTYEQHWNRERPFPSKIRDAHGLYIETLAELGPIGLGLLVSVLGIPVAAALRARRRPLASAALGAFVVYTVHAGADWDWELTAVTLTAVFLGGSLLVSAREDPSAGTLPAAARVGAIALTLAAVGFAFVGLVGNMALSDSGSAALAEDWPKAEAQARKAIAWAPWSSQGWEALGEAQLQQGKLAEARASFRRAIAKDPHDWNLWLDLAFASTGEGRRRAALVAYRLNPLSPEIAQVAPALGLPERP